MKTFDYNRFLTLADADLYAYVEPFLDPRIPIPPDALQKMLSELPTYDESHAVYALELGPDHAPDLFAAVVPQYLAHHSQALRSSASRALNRLPDRLITPRLVGAARTALSSCPDKERAIWDSVLEDLAKRSRA